jgi:hypothetical protein
MGYWLPEGHNWDLHIEHKPLDDAGDFTGGGNKWVWHTTESGWWTVDAMYGVLRDKRAAPHFVIGGRSGLKHPVVIQMVALNQAGRALGNDSGDGFQTNRADCIQTEVCWFAGKSDDLTDWHYKALANLIRLTNIEVPDSRQVVRNAPRSFSNPSRYSDSGFVSAKGHVGHVHVPDNDHWDPGTGFRMNRILDLVGDIPNGGYDL